MFFIGFLILSYLIQPYATTSIEYTKPYVIKWYKISLQSGRCSFIFATLLVHTTSLKPPLKIRSSTSANFYLHIPPLFVRKIILTISISTPFFYILAISYLSILAFNHPKSLRQKHFSCFSHLANSGCAKGSGC